MSSTAAILFIGLIVFMILNVPVGIAIGMACWASIIAGAGQSNTYIATQLVAGADSFTLLAIPLFILAGELMGAGGVSKRILDCANAFLGRITGSVAIVTVVVCMFFAAVSGSGPATVAAVGGMVFPSMMERGYSKPFSLALIACAGSIGVIIPPSIPMVIYGVSTNTSISGLFMAGFMPGFLIGGTLIILCYVYCKKQGWVGDPKKLTAKEKLHAVWEAKWALINPIIILGGIYGGIFTPTEAAGVACVYAFVCGVFIHRELSLKQVYDVVASACSTTGTTMVIIGCATAFTKVLTIQQVPTMVTNMILAATDNKILLLLFINILLLIVGCFMDTTPAIMVLAPILLPVAQSLGLSSIHFGIIMVVNLAIGFITPPLGINLFVAARVGETKLTVVCQGIIMFIIAMIFDLMLITYIPWISEVLPRAFGFLQ